MASFSEIVVGRDEATLFQQLLSKLKGRGLPTLFWGGGDPIPVILEHGFSPLLATVYSFASDIARGGALSLAQALAESDLDTWNNDPLDTFLGRLALEDWLVAAAPPAFAAGTERLTNTTGAPITVPRAAAFQTQSGLIYRMTEPASVTVPAGGTVYVSIQATQPGAAYNVDAGAINRLVTTVAGLQVSNQPAPPSATWLVTFGGARETPASVVRRCRANWARLSRLQAAPADAYVALALDSAVTGTSSVKKVAVWPNYSAAAGTYKANTVTLYLGGDAGPVTVAEAALVRAGVSPYIGLHDQLEAEPCGSANYAPAITCYLDTAAGLAPAATGVTSQFQLLQQQLQIGGVVYASAIRRAVLKVPQVAVEEDVLADFVPAKNALVALSTTSVRYLVGRP